MKTAHSQLVSNCVLHSTNEVKQIKSANLIFSLFRFSLDLHLCVKDNFHGFSLRTSTFVTSLLAICSLLLGSVVNGQTLIETSASSPVCEGTASTITLIAPADELPIGHYSVEYNLDGENAGTQTATMTVSTAGTGTFLTPALTNAGSTTITITKISAFSISANNTTTILVTADNTVTLSSAIGTDNQTICSSTAITNITYNTTGATGATISGLPTGVGGTWSNGIITIYGTPSVAGNYFYTITLTGGCGTITQSGTITVNPLPTATISGSTTVCQGSPAPAVVFTGAGGTAPYTFTYKVNGGTDQTVTTTTGNSITVPQPTGTAGTYTYTLVSVKDGTTTQCSQNQIGEATITVVATAIVTKPANQTFCNNELVTLAEFSGTNATSFTWTNSNTAIGLAVTGTGNLPSFTAANTSTTPITATITVTPENTINGVSCNGTPETFTIIINPSPTLSGATQAAHVCEGSSATINLTGLLASSTSTITYTIGGGAPQTVNVTASASGAASFITPVLAASNNDQALVITGITVTNSTSNCTKAFTQSLTLNVSPTTVAGTVSANQIICSGMAPADLLLSGNTGNVIRWERSTNSSFTSPVTINGTSTTLTGSTIGSLTATTYFRAVLQSGVCGIVNSAPVIITVRPLPTATISGATAVCEGAAFPTITFTNQAALPVTITYQVNGSNQNINVAANGTATITQATSTAGTYAYTLVSVAYQDGLPGCSNPISGQSATVRVNPLPTATISGTTTVCQSSTAPTVTFSGAGGTAPYTFIYKVNGGADQIVTTTSGNSVTVPQLTGTAGTFTYTLVSVRDASSTQCSQAQSGTAVITVNPLPTITIAANASLPCRKYPNFYESYSTSTLSFSGNTGNQYSITWDNAGKTAGLQDVAYTNLTTGTGTINIAVPSNLSGGTFTGTLTVKNAAGCISQAKTFILKIATHTIKTPGDLTTFCYIDTKTPVVMDMSGSIPGYTYYLWDINVGQNDPKGQHALNPPDNGGAPWQFTLYGQNRNWCYRVASVSPEGCITVSNLICPTLPPVANIQSSFNSCGASSTATLTVRTTDATSISWEVNDGSGWKPLPAGAPYTVQTTLPNSTLTISPVTAAMNGWQYRIQMGAQSPCTGPVASTAATLVYSVPISGVVRNNPPTTYCYGATASAFSITITAGNGLSYQWYSNTVNSTTGGTLIDGATTGSYTPPTTTSGLYYYVVVSNTCGSQTAIWGPVSITPLTQITTQPIGNETDGSGLYCENGTITPLTVMATGTAPFSYQWYRMGGTAPAPTTDTKVGTNSNSFTPLATEGTANYYVVVTGCDAKTSNVVPVTIVKPLTLSQLERPTALCYQSAITLQITASVPGKVTGYQWYKNNQPIADANGDAYTIPSMTDAENGTYYVIVKGSYPCNEVLKSNEISLVGYATDLTVWTSGADTDEWHEERNWSCGIPTLFKDAIVPVVSNNKYPYIDNSILIGQTRKLTIEAGGPSVTLDGLLQMAGTVTNNGTLNAYLAGTGSTGTIEFVSNENFEASYPNNTTYAQSLVSTGGTPVTKTQHLAISNQVTLNIPVDVYGRVSFRGSNKTLVTGDALTLKSVSSAVSAMIADRTNGTGTDQNNSISGQVTVERFIDGAQGRKWRLVTAPVKDININQAWQEGMTMNNGAHKLTGTGTAAMPTPKFGTLITGGATVNTATLANGAGFDFWNAIAYAQSSIRYYAGNADWTQAFWQPLGSTKINGFDNNQAYLLFVRGDRSITTTSGGTILRPKGLLKEDLAYSFTVNAFNSHTLVGNPYASPLNFHKIYQDNNAAIQPYFWIWQPSLTAYWGGYALIRPVSAGSTNYEMVPDGSMTGIPASQIISSGQGFFVVPVNKTTNATITIGQTHKDANNATVAVFRETDKKPKKLFANLYAPATSGQDVLLDGILAEYESGSKSGSLAKPLQNGENLSVQHSGRDLILATGDLPRVGDTLYLRLWNTTARSYRFRIRSANFTVPGVSAVLVDKFLAKETPLTMGDGITTYDFRITGDAASKDQDRFFIVYQLAPLPVVFLNATEKRYGIQLQWNVPEDVTVAHYVLEKSTGGDTFTSIFTATALGSVDPQQYGHLDGHAAMVAQYRVKMTGVNGEVAYSNTVTVELKQASGLTVYPNPVVGSTASLQFTTKPQGNYNIVVYTPAGQQVGSQVLQHPGGTATYVMPVTNLASGTYILEVAHPNSRKEKLTVVIAH